MKNGERLKCGAGTVYVLANGVVPGSRDREYVQPECSPPRSVIRLITPVSSES